VCVIAPERFERPAPYSVTLDAQWGLLSPHIPWSWPATTFPSLERPLPKWVMGILGCFLLSVVTLTAPVTRPDHTQTCVSHNVSYRVCLRLIFPLISLLLFL